MEEGVSNPIRQVLCELRIGRRRRPSSSDTLGQSIVLSGVLRLHFLLDREASAD